MPSTLIPLIKTSNPVIVNQLKRLLLPNGWSYTYQTKLFSHPDKHSFRLYPHNDSTGYWRIQYIERPFDSSGNSLNPLSIPNFSKIDFPSGCISLVVKRLLRYKLIDLDDV